jgi:hypothetical protein
LAERKRRILHRRGAETQRKTLRDNFAKERAKESAGKDGYCMAGVGVEAAECAEKAMHGFSENG